MLLVGFASFDLHVACGHHDDHNHRIIHSVLGGPCFLISFLSSMRISIILSLVVVSCHQSTSDAFLLAPVPTFTTRTTTTSTSTPTNRAQLIKAVDRSFTACTRLHVGGGGPKVIVLKLDDFGDNGDDDPTKKEPDEEQEDDDEDDDVPDAYMKANPSEFLEGERGSLLAAGPVTTADWGGEYGRLRERFSEQEAGGATPSSALFRLMTSETPNQAIGNFVRTANPQVIQAMSGAVNGLLGGLSNPSMGMETLIKASGDKIANLCFQLQMTGYMFRNAEYVLALKDLMNLRGSASLQEYKEAFDKLDTDGSGYIESDEIEDLLQDVYQDAVPQFEVDNFLNFFDSNNDGKISWEEFERGLGDMTAQDALPRLGRMLPGSMDDDDDDDDDYFPKVEPNVSGVVEVEMKDGSVITVEAKDYIESLKKEAEQLKEALRRESGQMPMDLRGNDGMMPTPNRSAEGKLGEGLVGYIASRDGDLKSLTQGISPEIVETMQKLVDFVLNGGSKGKKDIDRSKIEMELPGSALQQLALWQLVLGYKLREAEATGDYLKLLE